MSFVRYKIGDIEEIIQFNEGIEQELIDNSTKKFNLSLEEGISPKQPAVIISLNEPNPLQKWKRYSYILQNNVKIYHKNDGNKMYFYFVYQHFEKYIYPLIFNCLTLTLITGYDIIRMHGMLLTNGDVIFGTCNAGKTTLGFRINNNNQNLKCLCDDDVLIDLKNNTVYPLPYFWWEGPDIFMGDPIIFKSYNINRIMYLKQGENEEIKEIKKLEFQQEISRSLCFFLTHPFASRKQDLYCKVMRRWIIFRNRLQEEIEKRLESLQNTYLSNIESLCLYTNTNDLNKKFNVIEDK